MLMLFLFFNIVLSVFVVVLFVISFCFNLKLFFVWIIQHCNQLDKFCNSELAEFFQRNFPILTVSFGDLHNKLSQMINLPTNYPSGCIYTISTIVNTVHKYLFWFTIVWLRSNLHMFMNERRKKIKNETKNKLKIHLQCEY